ncbi:glycosyltransferase family 4 protein [Candidatus Uhrbacteria bacterium]|nr:glycosyltransferase family 4 protein [Candidatus Uhrbacteria bacterium]
MTRLIDIRSLLDRRRAGVGQYAYRLTMALLDRPPVPGRQYRLFAPGWKGVLPGDLPEGNGRIGYCRPKIPNRILNAAVSLSGRPRLEDLAGNFDVAWLPNINFSATGRPYAVTVHDLSFIRFPEFFPAKMRLWHAMASPARLFRQAARVIAVSRHTKEDLIETYGIGEERIEIVSPAVGPEFRPAKPEERAAVREKYGLPERFFLFLGTIEPRKNIDGLIEAFGRLKTDSHLVIAGGRGWLWQKTLRQAAISPARDRIHFIDYVDEADKPALYSSAVALTYPSFYEGFGMPPLEAMACGCPVIASFASSLGEVVGEAGLLIDPHDLNELTEAMRLVLEETGLSERLSDSGIVAAKRFDWGTGAERIDSILNDICER